MILSHAMSGGAQNARKYKIGETFGTASVPAVMSATLAGIALATTTVANDVIGVTEDTGTYSAAQSSTHAEGLVTVSWRPDNVYKALMSGAAAAGTALAKLVNTAASTTGLVVTATQVPAVDMDSGTLFGIKGANVNQSRIVTAHTLSTSMTVTVAFLNDIAVDDEFIVVPYAEMGTGVAGSDGIAAVQFTTDLTGANAAIASGTGANVVVVELKFDENDPTTRSYVLFKFADHVLDIDTV